MTDELSWLQQWFSAHCDGEWEHGFGITIETLDNPGWIVRICVEGTRLEFAQFKPVKTDVSETDWIQCRIVERQKGFSSLNYRRFEGFGGALNLPDILQTFRTWAETRR
jgi:immunity protein 53 of polymorphic toxin system